MRHLVRLLALVSLTALASVSFGCDKKADSSAASSSSSPGAAAGNKSVAITVDGDGFKPSTVKFQKGAPASLVFTRTSDETCATEVVFPQLNIKKELPKNTPVTITVPTDKEQTLTFQCGMGMYKSSVVVAVN